MTEDLAKLLVNATAVLLDFDGPVCSIFAGYPAWKVAEELRETLRDNGIEPPVTVVNEPDPLEVLRWTNTLDKPDVTGAVEDTLCAAERAASSTAAPTAFARETMLAAQRSGKSLVIVSNNSPGAVAAYLTHAGLTSYVTHIVGRAYAEPAEMKPNPSPIYRAGALLGCAPAACILVGDSLADVHAGRAAGAPVVAYANRPGKAAKLTEAGALIAINSMGKVASALAKSGASQGRA